MKRISVIALSLFYIFSTLGVLVTSNCCSGKTMSVSVDGWGGKTCRCSANTPTKKCCSKKMHWLKLDDNHQATAATTASFNGHSFVALILPADLQNKKSSFPVAFVSSAIHDPPIKEAIPLYLFHSDFRI